MDVLSNDSDEITQNAEVRICVENDDSPANSPNSLPTKTEDPQCALKGRNLISAIIGEMEKPTEEAYLRKYANTQGAYTLKWAKNIDELPCFPEHIFDNLPNFLQKIVTNSLPGDRDIILLGSLGCISSCIENVCGVYDDRIVYANLYIFITADAGMGKGALNLARELVVPINQRLHEQYSQEIQDYKEKLAEYHQNRKEGCSTELPTEPQIKTLIIPANSSASAFLHVLASNKGIGLMFETEGDTLSQTFKAEHGQYSDSLRKTFHHEPLSFCRRKDNEFIDIPCPRLSVVLAGTPAQVRRLIPDEEDGLLSRFCYYTIPFNRTIRNVFATGDHSKSKEYAFKQFGEEFLHINDEFKKKGEFYFSVPEHLHKPFIDWLSRLNEECCEEIDDGMQGVVRRLGLVCYRFMMIFSALRAMSSQYTNAYNEEGKRKLECLDEDFYNAIAICETLLYHAVSIYIKSSRSKYSQQLVTRIESSVKSRRISVYNQLPDEFTRQDFNNVVKDNNENPRTAERWISYYVRDGIIKQVRFGEYKKIHPEAEPP